MIQQMVIEQFKRKYKNPTYKDWVKLTGIEQTRIFRIRNGSPIKIDELEKVLQALGSYLIDIHSQNETLQVTNTQFQFQVLDALAENNSHINQFKSHLKNLKKNFSEGTFQHYGWG